MSYQDNPDEIQCRDCMSSILDFDNVYHNEMISPCQCKGSMKWRHRKCLDDWRRINKYNPQKYYFCEICKQPYTIISISPTFIQFTLENWGLAELLTYASFISSTLLSFYHGYRVYCTDKKINPSLIENMSLTRKILRYYLFGKKLRYKIFHSLSAIIAIFINKFVFDAWKKKNVSEIVIGHFYKQPSSINKPISTAIADH